jgi:hypothetical protein
MGGGGIFESMLTFSLQLFCMHDLICSHTKKSSARFVTRVTGLGKFSHIRRLFSLGSFFENYRLWATFFHGLGYAIILAKIGFLHFG